VHSDVARSPHTTRGASLAFRNVYSSLHVDIYADVTPSARSQAPASHRTITPHLSPLGPVLFVFLAFAVPTFMLAALLAVALLLALVLVALVSTFSCWWSWVDEGGVLSQPC
jgi:hypothetical protein